MGAAPAGTGGRSGRRPPPALAGLLDTGSPATPLRAAAAVLVVVAVSALIGRMDWDAGWFTAISVIGAVIVVPWGLGATARTGDDVPDGLATTVLVAGLVLVLVALANLTDAAGGEGGSGSVLFTALVFAAAAAFPGWRLNSPVCALLSSAAVGVAFLAAVDLASGIDSIGTVRWLALILTLAYAAAAAVLLNPRRRHAIQHVSAAGLALLAIAFTLYGDVVGGAISGALGGGGGGGLSFNAPLGWEIVVLAGSALLIAVAAALREPGPGYIGAFALSVSVGIAALPELERSLVGWPLVFLLLALAAVAVVLSGNDPAGAGMRAPRQRRPAADRPPRGPRADAGDKHRRSRADAADAPPRARADTGDEPRRPRATGDRPPWSADDEPPRRPRPDDGPPPPPPPA